jgi:hypothetical protein
MNDEFRWQGDIASATVPLWRIGSIREPIGAALQWFKTHPGTASWLEAVGSITAIVFVCLFALFQGRRTRSYEDTDRIRRAQGLALVLIPALTAFKPKIETAIIQESKPAPPDEVMHLLSKRTTGKTRRPGARLCGRRTDRMA